MEEACENGIGVIAEPGGSMRDKDVVDCYDKYGVSTSATETTSSSPPTPLPRYLESLS